MSDEIKLLFFLSLFADQFSVHKEREERIKQLKEKQNEGRIKYLIFFYNEIVD
jgi:hypothetical protein